MILTRRSFLQSVLALSAAPALARAGSLMPMSLRARSALVLPHAYGVGVSYVVFNVALGEEVSIHEHHDLHGGIDRYTYSADLGLVLPPNVSIGQINRIFLDGKAVLLAPEEGKNDAVLLRGLELAPYGNRVPDISFEVRTEEDIWQPSIKKWP